MKHPINPLAIFYGLLFIWVKRHNLNSFFVDWNKGKLSGEQEAHATTLPKLEALMSEYHKLVIIYWYIQVYYIVDIHEYNFVAD